MKLTLPVPPSANIYWRYERGYVHRSEEARAYRAIVGWLCLEQHMQPVTGNVCISLDVYRPAKRGDLDNYLKVCIDSLIGHAYADDKQVVEIHAMRHDDKANPRVEVLIQELP